MFGAIYIGMSGLNAYSQGLQQVSNNVTNLNTQGFRGSIVGFTNYYNAGGGDRDGSGNEGSGGGVGVADPRLDMKQGELRQTDGDLDLAIDGNGFLVLLDGEETLFTRTGGFEVDKDGYIVLAGTDHRLATLDGSGQAISASIDSMRTNAPKPTTTIKFADNLSSSGTIPYTLPGITVYDSIGTAHVWTVTFTKVDAEDPQWSVKVVDAKSGDLGTQTLKFSLGGSVDPTTRTLTFVDDATGLSAALDFSGNVRPFSSSINTLRVASVDGQATGTLTSISVNSKGEIELGYSNQQKASFGTVALADIRDPEELKLRSGSIFTYEGTDHSYLASEDPRVGQVLSKRLEASNVDLSKQFGDLILIQRGFQAASQIVSVSNDMIQQLFGIRGQG